LNEDAMPHFNPEQILAALAIAACMAVAALVRALAFF